MSKTYTHYVGIDCGNRSHHMYVVDEAGAGVHHQSFDHNRAGLSALIDALLACTPDLSSVVASLEAPVGGLVEELQSWGVTVVTINPKQLDRFRDRFTVSGAKDDRLDALVLAQSLRTDRHLFREVHPLPPMVAELWEYSREEEVTQRERRRVTNRLYAKVQTLYPSLLDLCPGADEPWLWALLSRLNPTRRTRRPGQAELDRLLRKHRIRRISAATVSTAVTEGPMRLPSGRARGLWVSIEELLTRLVALDAQHRAQRGRIRRMVRQLSKTEGDDGRVVRQLLSLPGVGEQLAAMILSEAYHLLHSRDLKRLRSYSGAAPVTRQSGGRTVHVMRKACSRRLRRAIHMFALGSIRLDDAARAYYQDLRSRGKRVGQALRSLSERFLRILIQMLKTQTLYDPKRLKCWNNLNNFNIVQGQNALA